MLDWLKKYWPALILIALLIAMLDGMISSLITCHPIGTNTSHDNHPQPNQECTALAGPVLLSLFAVVHFTDAHGEAITGVFTIFLVVFTGRLWFSTEKLWNATRISAEAIRNAKVTAYRDEAGVARIERNEIPVQCRRTPDFAAAHSGLLATRDQVVVG